MASLPVRIAFALALILGNSAAAGAGVTYDPMARGIDRVCNAFVPSAAPRDVVELARVPGNDGSVPIWRRSDAATKARLQSAPDAPAADFARIVFDRGGIVFADTVHVDARATGTETRTWCFVGGRLSRATIEIFDAAADAGWRRWLYYGDDVSSPLSEDIAPVAPGKLPDPRARPPMDMLFIDAFATPTKLPFYDPAIAALARKR